MKKISLLTKIAYTLIAILSLGFISACREEPDPTPSPAQEEMIIGTWELMSSEDDEYWEKPCIFRFNENNMLTITFAKGKENEESVPCKYTTEGSKLIIDFGYGDEVFEGTYKIDHDTLTFDLITYDPEDPSDVYPDFLTLKRILRE